MAAIHTALVVDPARSFGAFTYKSHCSNLLGPTMIEFIPETHTLRRIDPHTLLIELNRATRAELIAVKSGDGDSRGWEVRERRLCRTMPTNPRANPTILYEGSLRLRSARCKRLLRTPSSLTMIASPSRESREGGAWKPQHTNSVATKVEAGWHARMSSRFRPIKAHAPGRVSGFQHPASAVVPRGT